MADFPEELKRAREDLRSISGRARENARSLGYLAERADAGAAYLDFIEQDVYPHLSVTPSSYSPASGLSYNQQLQEAQEHLKAGDVQVSSAVSNVQVVVSGSSTMATGLVSEIFEVLPPEKARTLRFPAIDRSGLQARLDAQLKELSGNDNLARRRRGAWDALNMGGDDSRSQAAHSMREILTGLLDTFATIEMVAAAPWWKPVDGPRDGVSKGQKVQYFIIGHGDPSLITGFDEVERQVEAALDAHTRNIGTAHRLSMTSPERVRADLVALEDVIESLLALREVHFMAPRPSGR